MSNNPTRLICGNCGAEIPIPEHTILAIAQILARDLNLGTVVLPTIEGAAASATHTCGASSADAVNATVLAGSASEPDPIAAAMAKGGKLYNAHLFKQHVLAQLFEMMDFTEYERTTDGKYMRDGFGRLITKKTGYIGAMRHMAYEYSLTMMTDELMRQMAMVYHGDLKNYELDNISYNKRLAVIMANDYFKRLVQLVNWCPTRKCKGEKYKLIPGAAHLAKDKNRCYRGHFVKDIESCVYKPISNAIYKIKVAKDATELYDAWRDFMELHVELRNRSRKVKHTVKGENGKTCHIFDVAYKVRPCNAWREAYMGYGGYWGMQNLIEFHGALVHTQDGTVLNRTESMKYLNQMLYKHGAENGHWLYYMFLHLMEYNNIDPKAKRAEWAAQYEAKR